MSLPPAGRWALTGGAGYDWRTLCRSLLAGRRPVTTASIAAPGVSRPRLWAMAALGLPIRLRHLTVKAAAALGPRATSSTPCYGRGTC